MIEVGQLLRYTFSVLMLKRDFSNMRSNFSLVAFFPLFLSFAKNSDELVKGLRVMSYSNLTPSSVLPPYCLGRDRRSRFFLKNNEAARDFKGLSEMKSNKL